MNIKQTIACLFMAAGTAHGALTAHYGLVSKDQHLECQDKLDSYNGTMNTNLRAAKGWFKGIFSSDNVTDELPIEIQECLNPSPLSQASYYWGTTFMDPIINKGNEWFGHEDKSIKQRTTESAQEVINDASEGVSSRYERSKDWIANQWNSIRGNEEEIEEPEQNNAPIPPIAQPVEKEEEQEVTVTPRYNENGDLIEPATPNWRERTKDTIDGIDWTPWN